MDTEDWEHLAATARRRHGVVGRADLRSAGIDRRTLHRLVQAKRLVRAAPNAWVMPGAPPTWRQGATIAQVDAGGVLSHDTSAAAWRFDTFHPERPFRVLIGQRALHRRDGVRFHASNVPAVGVLRHGLLVTDPVRTLLDLSATVPLARLEHAVDSALRDGRCTVDELADALDAWRARGRRRTTLLDAVLEGRRGPVPESVLERRFLRLVVAAGLPMPELQVPAGGGRYRVDFAWPAHGLVVEVDGHRTHSTPRQLQHDAERTSSLILAGATVISVTSLDLDERPGHVIDRVVQHLARRAAA